MGKIMGKFLGTITLTWGFTSTTVRTTVLWAVMFLAATSLATLPAHASWWNRDREPEGSGHLVTETRDVADFTGVVIDCAFDVHIRFGSETRVELTYDDNLIERIETEVRRGRLVLDCARDTDSDRVCEVRITVPRIETLEIGGAADVDIRGFEGGEFTYELHGAGDLFLEGRVDELEIELQGAGSVDARDLVAGTVEVDLCGAGSVKVHATESFRGDLSGVGSIDVFGDPRRVRERVSGIGSIDFD